MEFSSLREACGSPARGAADPQRNAASRTRGGRTLLLSLLACLLAACGGDDASTGDDVIDAAVSDGPAVIDANEGPPDAGTDCAAAMVPPLAMISGTEGIAIAADGTIYYSQNGNVGRWVPGAATAVDNWVALTGATTVWGMAIAADGMLYVATPGGTGTIWKINTVAVTPVAEVLYPSAGSANGLTLGPDGAVYYSNFAGSGHIYRVTTAGVRTTVTTTTISQPNGVLFDANGTMLVLSYSTGDASRITLDANHAETARAPLDINAGNPDGLARDTTGRYYVTDNGGDAVLRYDSSFANVATLLPNVGSAANMAFGRGPLCATDLYVTSSGALRRIQLDVTGVP